MPPAVMGLDIGQLQDPSSLVVVEIKQPPQVNGLPDFLAGFPVYECRAMQQWRLRTPYSVIAADLARICRVKYPRGVLIAADASGVGRGVCEIIGRALQVVGARAMLTPVTITGGLTSSDGTDGTAHLSKTALVSLFQAMLAGRRFRVAARHPLAPTLRRQLGAFKVKVSAASGAEIFGGVGKNIDDLVFAAMLACWRAQAYVNTVGPELFRRPDNAVAEINKPLPVLRW